MSTAQPAKFLGHDCYRLANVLAQLLVTQSIGPRIISFGFTNGENILAEVPDATVECPGVGPFHFYGGHRLWAAPEDPSRTYLPDDGPIEITFPEDDRLIASRTESPNSLRKSIEIHLAADSAHVEIKHRLTNIGARPLTCAPWAITQLKTGGTAILPQSQQGAGVLPNRSLAMWTYTDMSGPNVQMGKDYIFIHAAMKSPFKLGFPNPSGWLAYWWKGLLFVKHAAYDVNADYFDFGSSSECYCDERFLELETLAPITVIPPGGTASHVETWDLYESVPEPRDEPTMRQIIEQFGLD